VTPASTVHRPFAAVDLDRTLIYSSAAAGDPASLPALRVVEIYDEAPLSRMTEKAWALTADLMDSACFVPVTTRTQAQYERVALPRTPGHALCANGGVLLVDGARDAEWDDWAARTAAQSAPLAEASRLLEAVANEPWVKLIRNAEGLFCYLVATERSAVPDPWLDGLVAAAAGLGWTVSVQGRKVYAVPQGLSKATGVVRLCERLGCAPSYATGDSLLDAPMLAAAAEAIRPAHGELHDQGWTTPGLAVTAATGALAGEEIVAWLLDRVRTSAPRSVPSVH
jgi:hypothetical protein